MSDKFQIVVADCPWSFKDSLKMPGPKRSAQANYDTMTMQKIREMPVEKVCDPAGTVLCLWVPSSLLQDGLDTMKTWGFTHKQTYIWVKTKKHKFDRFTKWIKKNVLKCKQIAYDKFSYDRAIKSIIENLPQVNLLDELTLGMGHIFRQSHEICLIGTLGKVQSQIVNRSQRSVSFAENLRHSAKPNDLQKSLELMFPAANKLELFARRVRPGWTCLGNEIDGKDIYDALADLE